MADDQIRIALIGAGLTGTPLLHQLLDHSFVEVCIVADMLDDAPGVVLARAHSIPTTTDFLDVTRLEEAADLIIEVSGDENVEPLLRKALAESGSTTLIMPELAATLMLSLARGEFIRPRHSGQK